MPITTRYFEHVFSFHVAIAGRGFGFQIGGYDARECCFVIFSWHVLKNFRMWRSETHSCGENGYHFRRIVRGELVEDISFRSPVINGA